MKKIKKLLCLLALTIAICGTNIKNASAEEVELKSFSILTEELYQEEKIYYDIEYTGDVRFIGIWAKETTNGEVFYKSTSNLDNGYFDLAEKNGNVHNGTGTFQVTGVTLGKDSGIMYYSTEGCGEGEHEDCAKYDFSNMRFTIKRKPEEETNDDMPIYDYVLSIDEQQVYKGEKVYVHFGQPSRPSAKPLSSTMLSFTNQSNNEVLNVYLASLENNPYFIVPSTAAPGTYSVNYGYVTFADGTSEKYQNKSGKVFSYGGKFTVKEKELNKENYTFNNEDYGQTVKADLGKLNSDAIITINANNSPIINKELFEMIKSTDKTLTIDYQNIRWVFSGRDIINPKAIEVSVKLEEFLANNASALKNIITTKSALLEFTNNGDLPGKTLIKINSKDVEKYFDSEVLYVYYYDEANDNILKVAMEVQKNDGFFEFYINHDSKYILTSEKIKENNSNIENDSALNENTKEKDNSPKNSNNIVLYISIGASALVVAIITCVLIAKKNKTNKPTKNDTVSKTIEKQIDSSNKSDKNSESTSPNSTTNQ